MNYVRHFAMRLNLQQASKYIRKHRYLTVCAGLVLTALVSGVIYTTTSAGGSTSATNKNTNSQAATKQPSHDKTMTGAEQPQTSQNIDGKSSDDPKVQVAAQTNQRRLKVSPSTITIKAGGRANVTVATEDGKAVTMPMFYGPRPSLFTNFAAAPFKPSWTGDITSMTTSPPGTYNLQLGSQLNGGAWYYGAITVIITPTPHATVSVNQIGYDTADDVALFNVRMNRLYGYDKPIERIFGYTHEDNLECYGAAVDQDNYIMSCTPIGLIRPGSGTIHVNVFTTDTVYNGSGNFSLPPR